jgi:hypothetical protein
MTTNPEIQKFVTKVRATLADLDPSVAAELTDGLEADLTERAETEGENFKLGKPAAYAAELRASAGLGSGSAPRGIVAKLARNAWNGSKNLVNTLRPAWWVARGIIFGWLASWLYTGSLAGDGNRFHAPVIIVLTTALSVALGIYVPRTVVSRITFTAANLVALVVAANLSAGAAVKYEEYRSALSMNHSGMVVWKGHNLGRIDALDANGKLVPFSTLRSQYGWIFYKNSSFYYNQGSVNSAKLAKVLVGLTTQQAMDYLSVHPSYTSVDVVYKPDTAARGTVIGVDQFFTEREISVTLYVSDGNR